jgi:hypothetical protein
MEVSMVIGTQDLKALFRAQEIIGNLFAHGEAALPGLEYAIDLARTDLETRLGRRRYLREMLSDSVAYALPGLNGMFFVQLAETGRFELKADLPVVTQIAALELVFDERATLVIHKSGVGSRDREYPL